MTTGKSLGTTPLFCGLSGDLFAPFLAEALRPSLAAQAPKFGGGLVLPVVFCIPRVARARTPTTRKIPPAWSLCGVRTVNIILSAES